MILKMNRRQLYNHFILTDWRGLGTKIKQMKKEIEEARKEGGG